MDSDRVSRCAHLGQRTWSKGPRQNVKSLTNMYLTSWTCVHHSRGDQFGAHWEWQVSEQWPWDHACALRHTCIHDPKQWDNHRCFISTPAFCYTTLKQTLTWSKGRRQNLKSLTNAVLRETPTKEIRQHRLVKLNSRFVSATLDEFSSNIINALWPVLFFQKGWIWNRVLNATSMSETFSPFDGLVSFRYLGRSRFEWPESCYSRRAPPSNCFFFAFWDDAVLCLT